MRFYKEGKRDSYKIVGIENICGIFRMLRNLEMVLIFILVGVK